jgi:hypothetical protein
MGFLSGRVGIWRQWLSVTAALVAALVTFVAAGRPAKAREEEPRTRHLDYDTTLLVNTIQSDLARASSLWLDGRGFECRVAALYDAGATAWFSSVLTLAAGADDPTPRILTLSPGWDAQVHIERSATYEAAALAA